MSSFCAREMTSTTASVVLRSTVRTFLSVVPLAPVMSMVPFRDTIPELTMVALLSALMVPFRVNVPLLENPFQR